MTGRPGVVYATTTIHVGLPGHEAPYTLAYVDVDGGRVLAPVDGRATVGERVALVDDPTSASGLVATHRRSA
ncbi:OB-fold domain-containing protein [Agromyces sp. H66]|uniref:OB-fold domain-containing protein n=1 Tax=Agromyces sp. H66 TaxID=2529859 RepID=UPI0010AADB00|nr:OB-fold domain-containing protein [Agromyces sp. H66]